MSSFSFKSTFVFLLLFSFVGQVTASAVMSCEMPSALTQQQTTTAKDNLHAMHAMHGMEASANNIMNHDCCADDASASSEQCGGNCQCLIAGCSLVYVEAINALNNVFMPADQVVAKPIPAPRTQFLSFLFRPPIA